MTFRTSFIMFDRRYEFLLNTDNLDRNYSDEAYAYWIVERDGHFFEIIIWKDAEVDGDFTTDGVVFGYKDKGDFEDGQDNSALKTEILLIAA